MKPGMGWPIGIVVVLATTVVANLVVMGIANSDPSFAITPDYYQKAVQFDSTLAHANASAKLGWTASASIEHDSSAAGTRVTVTIADSLKQPISRAVVSVNALYVARANDVLSASLVEVEPGVYRAPLAAQNSGQWEVQVSAVRGTEHFVHSIRTEVQASTARSTARP